LIRFLPLLVKRATAGLQVCDGSFEALDVVSEHANPRVAVAAKEPTKADGCMTVIDDNVVGSPADGALLGVLLKQEVDLARADLPPLPLHACGSTFDRQARFGAIRHHQIQFTRHRGVANDTDPLRRSVLLASSLPLVPHLAEI
jgi:hypothetical protein